MEYVHPNYHVILIHFPLALLGLGILIELFSFLWRTSTFRTAGRWMIVLGALLCLPAVTTGIYAFRDVVGGSEDLTWMQRRAMAPLSESQWDFLTDHLWLNVAAVAVFLVAVLVWIGSSDHWRRRLRWPALVLLLIGMGLLTSGAWHGGEMVYLDGVAVAATSSPAKDSVKIERAGNPQGVEKLIDPLQVHLILVGLTLALAAAALGLSYRSIAEARQATEPKPPEVPVAAAPTAADMDAIRHTESRDDQIATALSGEPIVVLPPPTYPPARFWLLAALLGLLAASAGAWLVGAWTREEIEELLETSRTLAHSILGVSIIVLCLILAAITRWSRRRPIIVTIVAALLVLAVAAQIWIGVLLTFDGMAEDSKTWYRFQSAPPATQPTTQPTPSTLPAGVT